MPIDAIDTPLANCVYIFPRRENLLYHIYWYKFHFAIFLLRFRSHIHLTISSSVKNSIFFNYIYANWRATLAGCVYIFFRREVCIHTNKRKRAFERYSIARIVIKLRGWFPIGTRGIYRLRTHICTTAHACAGAFAHVVCMWVCVCRPIPLILISTRQIWYHPGVIPWALTHLPTKEHLCEPIRNALATCSQVACPTRSMNSLSV